jgi:probable HAF family extracellular repeat protein
VIFGSNRPSHSCETTGKASLVHDFATENKHRRGIVALAAALLLAALAVAGSAGATAPTASAQEPPPVSCIVDSPVGPPGPGFVLSRGKFTTIDVPGADVETAPYGINNRGQIVGGYDTAGVVHGFLIDRGRYKTIDFQGAARTTALRINARGQILGNYEDARGGCHGFLLEKGRFKTIDVPGAPTMPLGLNDRGQIAGTYFDAQGLRHGFVLDKGVYTTIDVPGAAQTAIADINNRGQILGTYLDAHGTFRSFLLDNGAVKLIADVPGSTLSGPFGINNRGQIVGIFDANQVRHGFLLANGTYTTIDHPLASSDSQAHDLNDRGQIVGFYERPRGPLRRSSRKARSASPPTAQSGSGDASLCLLDFPDQVMRVPPPGSQACVVASAFSCYAENVPMRRLPEPLVTPDDDGVVPVEIAELPPSRLSWTVRPRTLTTPGQAVAPALVSRELVATALGVVCLS